MEDNLRKDLTDLILESNTAAFATLENDHPYVSLVAYSLNVNLCEFYILISNLANHTKNIEVCPNVSLLIHNSAGDSNNPLSSSRVTLTGTASKIERFNEIFAEVKRNYLTKNKFAEVYFNLGDFNLFSISIEKARFIAGFAKTYNLTKASLINLLHK